MRCETSPLDRARNGFDPQLPTVLRAAADGIVVAEGEATSAVACEDQIRERFPRTFGRPTLTFAPGGARRERRPLRVGVVLSGGPAPGGHNVISGLYDLVTSIHPDSKVHGFLHGPRGIFENRQRELDAEALRPFRNTGGFDLIGSGRDKIESAEQLAASRATCEKLRLDGLVVVGGDDSNTNAAVLSEYLLEHGSPVAVVGVPKTIDGDLKGTHVEASFGFDTATRVYSELIGNICRDARSGAKYWHFIKLMGRSASHVTLECALQTRPNIALIGEEVERDRLTLDRVVETLVRAVERRAKAGKGYGVCLIAEGLIEFIPEMRGLIATLNQLLAGCGSAFDRLGTFEEQRRFVTDTLGEPHRAVFSGLPPTIQGQLLLDRDSHGNVQVSRIDTEALLIELVSRRIEGRFQVLGHFFGYEGRSAAPTNFDACYTYALGRLAAVLVASRRTGYICGMRNLVADPAEWRPTAVPLTSMMCVESRKGRQVPVIGKALVRLDAEPFRTFARQRERWAIEDAYRYPGAIQYFGPAEVSCAPTHTLRLEYPS